MMKQSLWALAAAALFSVMAAFVKLCSDVHGPIEMVFYRSLFGVLVISLFVFRNRGTGRPTKKERRELDRLMEEIYYDEEE